MRDGRCDSIRVHPPNETHDRPRRQSAHATSLRHPVRMIPIPPCWAYPNWNGASGPAKRARSSARSPGYQLTCPPDQRGYTSSGGGGLVTCSGLVARGMVCMDGCDEVSPRGSQTRGMPQRYASPSHVSSPPPRRYSSAVEGRSRHESLRGNGRGPTWQPSRYAGSSGGCSPVVTQPHMHVQTHIPIREGVRT